MFSKLEKTAARFEQIETELQQPSVLADMEKWKALTKERAELSEIVEAYRAYKKTESEMQAAFSEAEKEQGELRDMLLEEGYALKEKLAAGETELKLLLLPQG